jgi:enoyl-CoA hydratase
MGSFTRLRVEVADRVAVVTLDRPERRNALDSTTIEELPRAITDVARRDDVDAVVLTGADPAFCAGLDLHELGSSGDNLGLPDRPDYPWPWAVEIPVIGAVNGPAIAGGFELALHCDFLVASERARFGDTHARVGQFPGAGLTVRLVEAIGLARAKLLCLTGNFIDARRAYEWGLVVDVVEHDDLLPTARRMAGDIASNDQRTVRRMLPHLEALARLARDPGMLLVDEEMAHWNDDWQPSEVAARRDDVFQRSRDQRQQPTNETRATT